MSRRMQGAAMGLTLAALLSVAPVAGDERGSAMRLEAFPMTQVRLLDGPFKTAMETNRRYIDSMDPERLLWNFRKTAGLPTPGKPLAGWEAPDCEVRGHFAGHYVSALALMYASTGDQALEERGAHMVRELAKVQQALGGGYLSAFPESHWDRVEAAERNWAQYYTIHKIMAGLFDQYRLCANAQALEVLEGMAGYFKRRLDKLSTYQMDKALAVTEEGGICEALWNLYAVTGNPDHRALAEKLEKAAFLGPLALEHDDLSYIHGNTHIPLAIGAARRYEVTGDERYRTAAAFFWDRIVNMRSYATGGTTQHEVWPEPNHLANTLGFFNQECCKTYNMLRLTRHLFGWTAEPHYADYYERALFNSILGAHDRQDGMPMYYIPLGTGYRKAAPSPMDHFYCCTGTGIESFAKFNDSIYFHDEADIYLNLFIASILDWEEKGIRLEQHTHFPEEEGTTLVIHTARPADFTLCVRIPYWADRDVVLKINGEVQTCEAKPASYVGLERTWRDGDAVQITLPMRLHTHPMPDDPALMSFMYGPLVLAAVLEDTDDRPFQMAPGIGFDKPAADKKANYDYFLAEPGSLDEWIKPVPGKPLTFRTVDQVKDYTFMPFHRITGERYGVYWIVTQEGTERHRKLIEEAEARRLEKEAAERRAARTVDHVVPGSPDEADHHLQGEGTQHGPHQERHWRHAQEWWSWDLAVLPDAPMTLACTYWGSDVGREFDILVDGRRLATQQLENNCPNEYVTIEYPIPEEWTKDRRKVTIRFQSTGHSLAGGVFECAVLKPIP